jgi:hypothetical protein
MTAVDHRARAEDVRWFVETGECLTGAARRIGITRDGLEKWLKDHSMHAELAALREREPGDPFTSGRAKAAAAARWAS